MRWKTGGGITRKYMCEKAVRTGCETRSIDPENCHFVLEYKGKSLVCSICACKSFHHTVYHPTFSAATNGEQPNLPLHDPRLKTLITLAPCADYFLADSGVLGKRPA